MALPLLPIAALVVGSTLTSMALTARALRSDDLEPRVVGLPVGGVVMGAGAAAAVATSAAGYAVAWPMLAAGVALGAVQSSVTSAQVARVTDPQFLLDRGGPPPRWMLQLALAPAVTLRR